MESYGKILDFETILKLVIIDLSSLSEKIFFVATNATASL